MHLTEITVASLEEGEALIQLMLDRGLWVSPHVITDQEGRPFIRCSIEHSQTLELLRELRNESK